MKKILRDSFYEYSFLSNLNANPSETKALFVESKCNPTDNNYNKNLYVTDGTSSQLFMEGIGDYLFLDDETLLVPDVAKTKEASGTGLERTVYNVIKFDTKEVIKSFELPLLVGDIKKFNDTILLLSALTRLDAPDYYKLTVAQQEEVHKERKANEDYQVIDEYPFFFNGGGYINKTRTSLFLFDMNSSTLTKITSDTMDAESFDICGSKIAYLGKDFDAYKKKCGEVVEYDVDTMQTTILYDKKDCLIRRVYFHNNELMVVGTFGIDYGFMENNKVYTLKDGELVLSNGTDISLRCSVGSDCRYGKTKSFMIRDNKAYFSCTSGGNGYIVNVDGSEIVHVLSKEGSADDFTFVNGQLLVIGLYDMHLQELYSANGDELTQISSFNDVFVNDYYVAKANRLVVKNEGYEIEGWYCLPYDYDVTKTYPAILDIHGGPKTAYGPVFYHEMQLWANLGYIVFYCNPRGSDGKGNDFADLRKIMGTIDYRDIMAFTDGVLELLPVDKDNIAVTGGSYGGYMTNWIIGHTNRFKCAVSQRSISNWISMVAASDYGIDFPLEQQFDDVYESHDVLWECSPLKHVKNAVTPTLFIHSFEDYRCPLPEAYQMYTALRCKGVDTRICAFKGENHNLSRSGKPLHRSRRLKEITEWIEKYTKN